MGGVNQEGFYIDESNWSDWDEDFTTQAFSSDVVKSKFFL